MGKGRYSVTRGKLKYIDTLRPSLSAAFWILPRASRVEDARRRSRIGNPVGLELVGPSSLDHVTETSIEKLETFNG